MSIQVGEPMLNLTSFCDVLRSPCSFEFGPEVYESFRQDPLAFFEQLDTMEPGEQNRSLRMIKVFIDLQEEAGGKIDFNRCVHIAFNRMMKGEHQLCYLFHAYPCTCFSHRHTLDLEPFRFPHIRP